MCVCVLLLLLLLLCKCCIIVVVGGGGGVVVETTVNIQKPILTFEMRLNILFGHSNSNFDILTEAEYRILTFKIVF